MKKGCYLLFLALFILSLGATFRPVLLPGTYQVKPEGSWEMVHFPKNSFHNDNVFIFSSEKPEHLRLELPEGRYAGYQYGKIALGNAGTVYDFVIGNQNSYFFDSLFIDLDQNGVITLQEEVKMDEQQNIAMGFTRQILQAQVKFDVNYDLSSGKQIQRTLAIVLTFFYQKTPDSLMVFYTVRNNTLLVGTGMTSKDPIFFALVDADGNGIYNDYGVDMLLFDRNGDKRFDYVKERQVLAELQELSGLDRKKGIYRFVVPVFPEQIGIVDGLDSFMLQDFEPLS